MLVGALLILLLVAGTSLGLARLGVLDRLFSPPPPVPVPFLPEVPTLAEMGFPEMDISQWFGAVASAATPNDVVAKLSAAFNKALSDPQVAQRLFNSGLEVVGGSPEEMGRRMALETKVWAKAAKEANLAVE